MPIHITTDQFTSFIANKWMDFQYSSDSPSQRNQKFNAVKYNVLVNLHGFFTLNGLAMVVGAVFRVIVPSTAVLWAGIGLFWRVIAERQIEVFTQTDEPKRAYHRREEILKSNAEGMYGNGFDVVHAGEYIRQIEGVPSMSVRQDQRGNDRVAKIFRNCLVSRPEKWEEDEISVFGYSLLKNPVPIPH